MNCDRCGAYNPDEAVYCVACGGTVRSAAATAFAAPVLTTPPIAPALISYPVHQTRPPYNCAVCGAALAAFDFACRLCRAPRGMAVDPNAPIPGAFVPVGAVPAPVIAAPVKRRERPALPEDLARRWNWGAFWLPVFWGLNHRVYQTLVSFFLLCAAGIMTFIMGFADNVDYRAMGISNLVFWIAGILISVYFGAKGNELAWRNRDFRDTNHFIEVQDAWAVWSKITFWFFLLTAIVMVGLGLMASAGLVTAS